MESSSLLQRGIYSASRLAAWIGGLTLCGLAGMSVISIAGRAASGFGFGPVPGDFELVEAGTALAVFCFLPWCHLKRGHAIVDMFWRCYPRPMQKALEVFSEALMLFVWVLLTWRMSIAMMDYRANGEATFILGMPVWFGYAACMPPAVLGCFAYFCRLLEAFKLLRTPAGFETPTGAH